MRIWTHFFIKDSCISVILMMFKRYSDLPIEKIQIHVSDQLMFRDMDCDLKNVIGCYCVRMTVMLPVIMCYFMLCWLLFVCVFVGMKYVHVRVHVADFRLDL